MNRPYTEIDGVPVVTAPARGPIRAGLVFRVGYADETAATHGLTHLVEHLALHRTGVTDYHFNGQTAALTTRFHMTGTPDDVVRFLDAVCRDLADPPVDRLAVEAGLLRSEAAMRGNNPLRHMALWRYGATGHGLMSLPEHGVHRLTEDDVREWAARYFTVGNAVLWIAGDLPPDLKINLPSGPRRSAPEPTSALPVTPAFFTGPDTTIALTAALARDAANTVYAQVLNDALFRELRGNRGLSYVASAGTEIRDGTHTLLTAIADTRPEQAKEAVESFLAVLNGLRDGTVEPEHLDAAITKSLAPFDDPDHEARRLPWAAESLLYGREIRTVEKIRADTAAVTPERIARIGSAVLADALAMVPGPVGGLQRAGFEAAPNHSLFAVAGHRSRTRAGLPRTLIVGPNGVSLRTKHMTATVLYRDAVLLGKYPDGGMALLGADGIVLAIEPTVDHIRSADRAAIEAGVDPAAVVRLPERGKDSIPRVTFTARRHVWDGRVRRLGGRLRAFWRAYRRRIIGLTRLAVVTAIGVVVAITGPGALILVVPIWVYLLSRVHRWW